MTNSDSSGWEHSVVDTVRIATGFVMGGLTASFFELSIVLVLIIGVLIVLSEWVYGFLSVMYEARRKYKEKLQEKTDTENQNT